MAKFITHHRVLSAIAISSLAVIFVPLLFNLPEFGSKGTSRSNIPPLPDDLESMVHRLSEDGVFYRPGDIALEAVSSTNESQPKVRVDGATLVWMIEFGAFKAKSKAQALVNDLRQKGYPTYLKQVQQNETTVWRLRVGPEMSVKRAEVIREILFKETGMKGQVIKHEP
ncbi:MAG: SPOR domain-containing protein [Gammaproteobacteria bacterium]|nr:SPOR domain-containing protein [Gammaproteobacteria bacterium]MDH5729015.1 SPOR domain-containing protein [Gammaproteobacteria bacterium]